MHGYPGRQSWHDKMGITLFDKSDSDLVWFVNFWNWRPIVEVVRRLGILPDAQINALHEQFTGQGLTQEEARNVAAAIRARVLPDLRAEERVLLDGLKTTEPDDSVFHHPGPDEHENYGATRKALEQFVEYCERCHGFEVN